MKTHLNSFTSRNNGKSKCETNGEKIIFRYEMTYNKPKYGHVKHSNNE